MQAEHTRLAQLTACALPASIKLPLSCTVGSLHTTQFFIQACLFNAVPYQPTLYLLVSVSISCIAVPCLEIDKEQEYGTA